MTYENLIVEKKGHICIITLHHPPVNAWNWGMMADFEKAVSFRAGVERSGCRVLSGNTRIVWKGSVPFWRSGNRCLKGSRLEWGIGNGEVGIGQNVEYRIH